MFKYILFIGFICCIAACSSDAAAIDAKAYEEQKQSLADQEFSKPLAFLHVSSEHHKNWIGQTVVSGTITNMATVSSYKNVRLKMLCYDDDNKMVEEHEDVLDAIVKPNASKDFKLRYRLPRGADSVNVTIIRAEIVK